MDGGLVEAQTGDEKKVDILNLRQSDYGNAQGLRILYGDEIRYCPEEKDWRVFDGVIWRMNQGHLAWQKTVESIHERMRRLAARDHQDKELKRFLQKAENSGSVRATLTMAANTPSLVRSATDYDHDPEMLGVQNGIIDLRTGEFRSSRYDDWLTMRAGCDFVVEAECPKWDRFLQQIFADSEELIKHVQKAVGYCLTGLTNEQVFFLCRGNGANGKSTLLEIVKAMLGDYAATAPLDTFDARRKSEQTNDLARLMGRRFVTIVESEQDRYLAEAKIKSASGEEKITCRYLHKEFFEYLPQFKIWMAMNHLPGVRGTDNGIWRRMRIIPFNKSFNEKEQNKYLRKELLEEMPGILNWAVKGLKMWREEGLGAPAVVAEATGEYRVESDLMGQWINECLDKTGDDDDSFRAGDGYKNYKKWMEEMGQKAKGVKEWGIEMRERGFERKEDNRGRKYIGISLREDWEMEVGR
jgi:putative DNA primase/helicase